MILTPDSSNVHNIAQIPESTSHHQYTDIASISSTQREPTLNLGKLSKDLNIRHQIQYIYILIKRIVTIATLWYALQ